MTDREIMQQALDSLITCEVQIESEWGVARSMEQIEADGDTSPVILALRERLAQPEQEPVALAQEVIGCFHAAEIEGLTAALANTTDEHLKDLVERRLMHALYAAQESEESK